MAQVTVFVDDAVRGTLPGICAKDGTPTADLLTVRDELGDRAGLGVAWLLLLLGPLGWLGLLIISLARSGRGEVLTVQVPMSDHAYDQLRAARRLRRGAVAVAVAGGLVGLWILTSTDRTAGDALQWRTLGLLALAAVVGAILTLFVADHRLTHASVQVDLDASRRWVTLSRVHPAFVAACQAHEQQHARRT